MAYLGPAGHLDFAKNLGADAPGAVRRTRKYCLATARGCQRRHPLFGEREHRVQLRSVLGQPPIVHFHVTGLSLDDPKPVYHLGVDTGHDPFNFVQDGSPLRRFIQGLIRRTSPDLRPHDPCALLWPQRRDVLVQPIDRHWTHAGTGAMYEFFNAFQQVGIGRQVRSPHYFVGFIYGLHRRLRNQGAFKSIERIWRCHLFSSKTPKDAAGLCAFRRAYVVFSKLKFISNELSMPIVAWGTSEALYAMQTDAQISSRFDPFALPKLRESAEFREFLVSFGRLLSFEIPSPLGKKVTIQKLMALSSGLTGKVTPYSRILPSWRYAVGLNASVPS